MQTIQTLPKVSQISFYLPAMVAFRFLWANLMTTATSIENPNLILNWWIAYPTGIIAGLATILWTVIHFDTIHFFKLE